MSPGTPVDIKGHVELKTTDITPPSEPVELQGKISKTTMESTAKGKKKKGQDVEKPDVIELAGHVKLEDKDIERPDPVVMNGKVVVTKNNIKLPEGGIDVKGNLILKNAEIANAIKEAAGKTTSQNTTSKSRGSLLREFISVNKELVKTKNLLDSVAASEKENVQKHFEDLKKQKIEIIGLLDNTNTSDSNWRDDRKLHYANRNVGYTRLRYIDSSNAKSEQDQIQVAQNVRNKYNNAKLSDYRKYRSEQDTYKLQQARLGDDNNPDKSTALKQAIDDLEEKKKSALNSMRLTIQEHTDLLDQLNKEDSEANEKIQRQSSIIKGQQNDAAKTAQTAKYQDLVDQLSAEQKKHGTAEEAESGGKVPTSIQLALQTQQQLIDAIGKTIVGTEEYNNAVKAAEDNWKNIAAAIDASNKAQKKLSDQTTSILRKFETLKEEASQSSNDELKNSIEGILTRARDLNAKDPGTYENYANELIQLKQDSYAVQAKHTLWRKGYKGLEKKGTQIAQGIEVARQMQEDGSLQDVDFKNIDELIAKLNTLPAQSDTYAETLKEIDTLWQEIKKQVDAVNESEKQAAKKQTAKIRDVKNILTAQRQNKNLIETVRGNNGSSEEFYSQLSEKQSKLNLLFEAIDGASDSEQALKAWASQNLKEPADNINSVTDAIRTLDKEYNDAQSSAESFNRTISQERSTNKAATGVANLKSQIHDYLETNKKIQGSNLAQPFQNLMNALNSETAPEKIGELKKQFAELRAQAKELGLESESLIDKFEKLFGTHFSTMITMAALHQMQAALRQVYQNVVDIDTAVTELRKVSEYAGKSLEEYMGRAAAQAQKLGVSISDYINSTADWKRLGYSDEDAENLATYSTLLRNVGDGIDDVNTSSSYLISTLKGFGLLASDAEDVVDKIDAVANTQPVTANDLGEILTRSSAAMSAANNTLEETIALGTAANSVIQDADSVGTMMKSLSMYLRAAKTEADAAGESTEGMADSVSELRTELKSLTGVDIMLDSKNFKSTYQIMKELSQVWGSLSDVTQANVTEMIAGKRNANGVAAILNNFDIAESTMESAANSANVAWEENEKYLDSIQGRLAQLDASFQALSTDVLSSNLVKSGVSFLTSIVKFLDKIINLTGALPAGLGIAAFATQLGEPKMTGFMIVPSNTPGGDTEQACGAYYIKCCSAREYLVKPTNMVA